MRSAKLPQHHGVQLVVFAALHHGLRKVPHRARIGHHQLHLRVCA
jgi:hypothetical protein